VTLTTVLGYIAAIWLPRWTGIEPRWGVAGLTASAGIAGWVEFTLLRRTLNSRIGETGLEKSYVAKLWVAAGCAAGGAWVVKLALGWKDPVLQAAAVLAAYGACYFGTAAALRIAEVTALFYRFRRFI
jgi:putative peptidoglycan lipid II flippase